MTEQELIAAMGGLHNGSLPGVGMAPTEERKHAGIDSPDGAGMRSAPAMLASPDSTRHAPQQHDDGVGCRCGKDWPHA